MDLDEGLSWRWVEGASSSVGFGNKHIQEAQGHDAIVACFGAMREW